MAQNVIIFIVNLLGNHEMHHMSSKYLLLFRNARNVFSTGICVDKIFQLPHYYYHQYHFI
jgi:hypothetical protein